MSDVRLEAAPRSKAEIAAIGWKIREQFHLTEPFLPVAALVEVILPRALGDRFIFTVKDKYEMGNRHGCVDPSTGELSLREDVYDGLCRGVGRDRFTACHELGHWMLHRGSTLNRVGREKHIPAYRDPEWQANEFSASILMPRPLISRYRSAREIAQDFGVSLDAADYRVRKLGLHQQGQGS